MMRQLPVILIYLRLVLGVAALLLSLYGRMFAILIAVFLAAGLVSDILDGIIARRLGISSEKLRRLDSAIDQIFWILIMAASYMLAPAFFSQNSLLIVLLLCAEASIYLVSFLKFKKEVATHAISSKIWTLALAATLLQLILKGESGWLFQLCFYMGIATRLEIIVILLLLKQWTNDVPSVYHALLIRRNKPIKRNKLFNG